MFEICARSTSVCESLVNLHAYLRYTSSVIQISKNTTHKATKSTPFSLYLCLCLYNEAWDLFCTTIRNKKVSIYKYIYICLYIKHTDKKSAQKTISGKVLKSKVFILIV